MLMAYSQTENITNKKRLMLLVNKRAYHDIAKRLKRPPYSVTVIIVSPRVHNIIEEESILLSNILYKRVLQSISAFHRLLP